MKNSIFSVCMLGLLVLGLVIGCKKEDDSFIVNVTELVALANKPDISETEFQQFNKSYNQLSDNDLRDFHLKLVEVGYPNNQEAKNIVEEALSTAISGFGKSFNKLNSEEREQIFTNLEKTNATWSKASCPTVTYGSLRAYQESYGNYSYYNCSLSYEINAKGQTDCDYELKFPCAPQCYANVKITGNTIASRTVLNSFRVGTIMARQVEQNIYILLGKTRCYLYGISNLQSTVKIR
jgi:hypothetical protein